MRIWEAEELIDEALCFGDADQIKRLSLLRMKADVEILIFALVNDGYDNRDMPDGGSIPSWWCEVDLAEYLSRIETYARDAGLDVATLLGANARSVAA